MDFYQFLEKDFESFITKQLNKQILKIENSFHMDLRRFKNLWTYEEALKAKQVTQNLLFFVKK